MQAYGVPAGLILKTERHLHETLHKKLEAAKTLHNKIVILTGMETPQKELFAVCLLREALRRKKSAFYIFASEALHDQDLARVVRVFHMVALMGVDLVTGYDQAKVEALVRVRALNNLPTILGCSSLSNLKKVLGKNLTDFISPTSVAIDVSIPETKIMEITDV